MPYWVSKVAGATVVNQDVAQEQESQTLYDLTLLANSTFYSTLELCGWRIEISSALNLNITAEGQLGNSNASTALHIYVSFNSFFILSL